MDETIPIDMDVHDVLRCLADADAGRRRPELCGGRYVVVEFDPDGWGDPDEGEFFYTPDWDEINDDDEDATAAGSIMSEASSLYGALDGLARLICTPNGWVDETDMDAVTSFLTGRDVHERDYEDWLRAPYHDCIPLLNAVTSSQGRLLAYFLMGVVDGPCDVTTAEWWTDPYLGSTPLLFAGARFVLLASAAPPVHDWAVGILRCQPTGTPGEVDRDLLDACATGDEAALDAAIEAGADVNVLDARGMTPLHHAVAHRRPDMVTALLTAGADPALQADYGNAPQFAAVDRDGKVRACVDRIDGEDHWRILRALLSAGAPVTATDRMGQTLLDHAIASRPYPAEAIRILTAPGAHARWLTGVTLTDLLTSMPWEEEAVERAHLDNTQLGEATQAEIRAVVTSSAEHATITRLNKIRFLLDSGAPTAGALRKVVEEAESPPHSMPGEILLALVEELLRHGARDDDGTALQQAEYRLENGHPDYRPTVELLRAARSDTAE